MKPGSVSEKDRNKTILRTLNQIIAVGNLMHAIPVGIKFCQFLHTEMKSINGIDSCRICLRSINEPFGDILNETCRKCNFFENGKACELHLSNPPGIRSFPLSTNNACYAYISVALNDNFSPEILPAIQNLANITAILIENDFQKKELQESFIELQEHRNELEKKVDERTIELQNSNTQLLKAVAILNQAQAVAHVGHWELNLINNILLWSDEVFRIFEISQADFKPDLDGFIQVIHPDDREFVKAEFSKSILNKSSYNIEHRLLVKSQSVKYVQEIGRIEYDEKGFAVRAVGMVLDITKRKMAELSLSESEKELMIQNEEYEKLNKELLKAIEKAEENDRLKTAFLHNISHEIRTPMNAIVGFSGILGDENTSEQNRKQYIDIIIKSSNQLLSIIDDIVKIATIEAGQDRISRDQVKIDEMMMLLFNQFIDQARQKNLDFRMNSENMYNQLEVITDATKLEEVLINLIGNAIKFTEMGYVEFGYSVSGSFLEFYVKDSGIGIPEELHSKIFERFRQAETTVTRKYGGSGLGLSISKSYIELLGGKIWIKSKVGQGSGFYFTLPLFQAEKTENPKQNLNEKMRLEHPKKVLIVEDEDFNYLFLEEILNKSNLILIRASNGSEAINICKKDNGISLVLMDLKMPVLDGFEASMIIKKLRPQLPIIAQTALSQFSDKEKALKSGCDDYIRKPIARNELFQLMRKYL